MVAMLAGGALGNLTDPLSKHESGTFLLARPISSLAILRSKLLLAAIMTAAIWLHRYDRRRAGRPVQSSILVVAMVAFGVQIAIAVVAFLAQDLAVDLATLGVATIALLLYVRRVIHDSLMVEGAEHEIGPDAPCPECHHVVPTMAFCPSCGAARTASSKRARLTIPGAV